MDLCQVSAYRQPFATLIATDTPLASAVTLNSITVGCDEKHACLAKVDCIEGLNTTRIRIPLMRLGF